MSGYRHRVVASNDGKLYTLPVNLHTLYEVYDVCTPEDAVARLEKVRIVSATPRNMEEWALSSVGPEIYRLLIDGYSRKQWGRGPSELPVSLATRVPVRLNFNNDYFDDRFQGIPIEGYTKLFLRMIDGIPVELSTDFFADRDYWLGKCDHVVYTGPIDRYFDYDEGCLEYRTLKFERSYVEAADYQGTAVVNYTSADVPWTRIVEHQHFEHERRKTASTRSISLITKEYPASWEVGTEPYYPMNFGNNLETAGRYRKRAETLAPRVFFGGRLGDYRYYDMHQAVGAAMSFCQRFVTEYA
jgi:UDP-galactopyranose mutase